jgi:hypothetical protein
MNVGNMPSLSLKQTGPTGGGAMTSGEAKVASHLLLCRQMR